MSAKTKFAAKSIGTVIVLGLMAGCGSSTKETDGQQLIGTSTVGLETCYNCHADGRLGKYPFLIGNDTVGGVGWLYSPHGNYETNPPVGLPVDNEGDPKYADFTDGTCQTCHDPLGDGRDFSVMYALYGIDEIGRVDRPVIGCESCHGPGGNHFGIGPIPFPQPGPAQCGQCHTGLSPAGHAAPNPEGEEIYEDFIVSPHAKSINEFTYVQGSTTDVTARCSRCHTDRGVKLYKNLVPGTTDYATLTAFFADKPALASPKPIECRTCHDVHNKGKTLLEVSTGAPAQSAVFNTCTTCHQLNKTDGTVFTEAYHDPSVNAFGDLEEVISDTHAAVPGDLRLNTGGSAVPLYFVNKGNPRACLDCHNPHGADTTINKQYALSGHGDATAAPWTQYDWKHVSRQSCQRCHTPEGFSNYADDPVGYDPVNNDFSYLLGNNPGARVDTDDQLETLYCRGCHTDNKGSLRDPGPITALYVNMAGNPVVFPDVSGSNVCMSCHTGRESGGTIENSAADFSDTGFINSHYLTGGATVFKASGYEYPGLDYSNVAFYRHDLIGSVLAPGTGTNGPCVGCHMGTAEPHLFLPVAKDGTGAITAITSTICASCHTGAFALTAAELEEEHGHFGEALDALDKQLQLRGFYFAANYPYFFQGPGGTGGAVRNWLTGAVPTTGKPNMGAAFNFNLLEHDPGAFAHNRFYVKRLIYDSIDWLDNNTLDDSVFATLNALDPGTDPYKVNAMAYLLSATNGRP